MTRINCIPPSELCRQHLLAEYRELPRVFGAARRWAVGPRSREDLPFSYRLGKGHVKFFFNKMAFLRRRHAELVAEMKRRGYKPVIDCYRSGLDLPFSMQHDWEPTAEAIALNRQRIDERLTTSKSSV